jgi:hypothetical protein
VGILGVEAVFPWKKGRRTSYKALASSLDAHFCRTTLLSKWHLKALSSQVPKEENNESLLWWSPGPPLLLTWEVLFSLECVIGKQQ